MFMMIFLISSVSVILLSCDVSGLDVAQMDPMSEMSLVGWLSNREGTKM